jgi:hypothetical protein
MAEVQGRKIINNMQIETSSGTVYWQEDEPTNPKDGDTWFKVINGKATNSYNRENGEWVEVAFASQIIAEELIGKIITAAEINGGEINGSTITGAEFINNFLVKESDVSEREGSTELQDGEITQDSVGWRLASGVRDTKAYENHYKVVSGQIQMQSVAYEADGVTPISTSSMIMTGGAIQLSLTDDSGTYVGRIDARALTNTPWNTIPLGPLYEVKDNGNTPQYRVSYNLDGTRNVEFRGAVGLKSGDMTTAGTGTVYRPFSTGNSSATTTIPTEIRPNATVQAIGSTNNTAGGQIGARYAVSPNGDFPIWVNGTSNYVDISAMKYTLP